MKKNKIVIPIILIGSFLLLLLTYLIINPQSLSFDYSNYHYLNDHWSCDEEVIDKLPVDLLTPINQPITLEHTLPTEFKETQTMLIRSSLQDLEVRLNGILIYEYHHDSIGSMNTYASLWHLIDIPSGSDGSLLSITTRSPYRSMSGHFNQVVFGTEADLNQYLFTTYGFRLVTGLIVMLVGISLIFINILVLRKFSESASLLGISAFFLGAWIVAESRLLQFFVGDTLFIGSLAYLSLAFLPLAMAIYIKRYLLGEQKPIFIGYIYLVITNLVFIILAHAFGWLDFFESIIFTHIIIIMGSILMVVLMWKNLKELIKFKKDIMGITFFFITIGVIELINFLLGSFQYISLFATYGIGILMIYFLFQYTKDLFSKVKKSYEKDIYHRLAYLDPLTKLSNRLAFNERLDQVFADPELLNKLMLIYFDMDDLKKINDTKGHLEGDQALIEIAERISHIYQPYGDIFRIGGDEFVFIGTELDKEAYCPINQLFDSYMEQQNLVTPYQLRLSYGVTFYNSKLDFDPKDILSRADREMYQHKLKQKNA